jgi:hypothetical protein
VEAEYADAPLGALSEDRFVLLGGEARSRALLRHLLRGGLEQPGGLHEAIRWACAVILQDGQEHAAAQRWRERLGEYQGH